MRRGCRFRWCPIVIPDAATGAVNYVVRPWLVLRVTVVNVPLAGCVGDTAAAGSFLRLLLISAPRPLAKMLLPIFWVKFSISSRLIRHLAVPLVAWALVGVPTYTPGFGALPTAPGLGSATFTINAATGAFQFNTLGSTRGTYVFNGTATGPGGSDNFSLTAEVRIVPEPATLSLLGLALVGFVGFARKRS